MTVATSPLDAALAPPGSRPRRSSPGLLSRLLLRQRSVLPGFDLSLGDMPLDDEIDRTPTREDEKKAARAHAKQIRKGRRGERRGRGEK